MTLRLINGFNCGPSGGRPAEVFLLITGPRPQGPAEGGIDLTAGPPVIFWPFKHTINYPKIINIKSQKLQTQN